MSFGMILASEVRGTSPPDGGMRCKGSSPEDLPDGTRTGKG